MRSFYIQAKDINSLENHLTRLDLEDETKSILFLMADDDRFSEKLLIPFLKTIKKPLMGGIFPELIFDGERKKSGVLLIPLPFELRSQLFDLSEGPDEFLNQLEKIQGKSMDPLSSLFVFVDALSQNKESFMQALFNFFGMNTSYIGGGAGSLSLESMPCIINNQGVHSNSSVIGWGNKSMSLGVAHGWHSFSGVLKVTETKRNIVTSINWRPAFEVYKEVVEEHSGMNLTSDNFSELAQSYPLGIEKLDAEMVVRDPFKLCPQGLHFVDAIQEGEYVKVLHGDIESLIRGASKAKTLALSKSDENMDQDSLFCIDCISRVLFMKEFYTKELETVAKNKHVSGVLTIGEIANEGDSFLEIYNKTIVLGLW
ncbi:FIST signal transduction protein [Ancylomarina sp.]|uniref:FIST signal transduction protein n=1 Tax=Ancylomarina sp. TaxID=1970196 RepID=UPI00356826B2